MGGIGENICWVLFIFLLGTMIDGIQGVLVCHFLGTAGGGGGGTNKDWAKDGGGEEGALDRVLK